MDCILAQGLTKTYGNTVAVNNIDLGVKRGSAFGFLGLNGAGKSTTIKMLTTLVKPTDGSINILGIDALKNPLQVRKRIGVVQQQHCYEPTLSVEQSLLKYGMMWDVARDRRQRLAQSLIEEFGLNDFRKKRNEDLSIGQRRRVQVAREFMHDMDLLFLDEPTVGLDPDARHELLDYLKRRVKAGLTIFYTSHVLSEVEYLCDEVAIIRQGRIIRSGTPQELKRYGHQRTIAVTTHGDPRKVKTILYGVQGCSVAEDTGEIMIRAGSPDVVLYEVLGRLTGENIRTRDIYAAEATLEDVFLETVHESDN